MVINTLNEEKNIARAIESVKWAQEIIVCDMYSTDDTAKIAKGLGARVINCKKIDYVEPARNFAISKTTEDWILILDADEEIPTELAKRLQEIIRNETKVNFVEIPRRNIIFGKGLTATGWWPDNHIRFFKKGTVIWKNESSNPMWTASAMHPTHKVYPGTDISACGTQTLMPISP